MQTFHHLNKVHTQTFKNPVCNYQLLSSLKIPKNTRGVSPCGLGHLHIKKYLTAKEELWKLKYFTMEKYNLQKILSKKPKSFKML
jgi:hypothetical protein